MKVTSQNLRRFRDSQSLVSIRRDECDGRRIQGFVIDFSDTLVLLQYVYDFNFDGRLLLRIADVTDIETSATDEFQKQLLDEEGDLKNVDLSRDQPVSSYDAFLLSLPEDEIVILEDEMAEDPEFIIGKLISVDNASASVRFFTGAANWKEDPYDIEIDRITSCQTRTNYINYYARHLSRNEAQM